MAKLFDVEDVQEAAAVLQGLATMLDAVLHKGVPAEDRPELVFFLAVAEPDRADSRVCYVGNVEDQSAKRILHEVVQLIDGGGFGSHVPRKHEAN